MSKSVLSIVHPTAINPAEFSRFPNRLAAQIFIRIGLARSLMALDDLLISTGVDQLIRLVKERGRVELGAAAKEMKQPVRTIEDWSHVLEEEGLIKVEYKLTKIYLVWLQPTAEYVEKKSEKLEAKASQAKDDITRLLARVQKGGSELAAMQEEVSRLETAVAMTPAEAQKLKSELAEMDSKYAETAGAASERLGRLKKKLLALNPRLDEREGRGSQKDVEKELAVLVNFEKTLQAQLDDNETFFGAFEARLEDFRKRIEEGRGDERIAELKSEMAELKSLKAELLGAMEALAEEQKSLNSRLSKLDGGISALADQETSIASAKKKLAELRRMGEDAKRQKEAIASQLADAITLVKKQASRMSDMQKRGSEAAAAQQALKTEYVDIAEEIARANEEIAAKQKEVSGKLSAQAAALDSAQDGKGSRIGREELQKVSFLLRDLKREEELLEENVRALSKESEILRMEAEPGPAKPQAREEQQKSVAFVEKVRLSQDEEEEFDRKREELRSLIHKMWEESKSPPS
jgi:chromosome segregation ATPase